MTNLKEINFGLNQYCGPAVLSALTGKTTDECAEVISRINGQRVITAVAMKDLMKAFEMLRFDVKKQTFFGRTLYAALVSLFKHEGFYIVLIPRHVVAVEVTDKEIFLVDNHSKQPLNASQSSRLLQKVLEVYKVTAKPEPKVTGKQLKLMLFPTANCIQVQRLTTYDISEPTLDVIGKIEFNSSIELIEIAGRIEAFARGNLK